MIRSIPQLDAIREDWDHLSARQQSPLLDHDWFTSCAEAFHVDGDLRVVTSWNGNTLCGAAPLVREGDRIVLLGGSRLFEPCDWLYSSDEVAADLVERALGLGRPLVLQRVPTSSGVVRALSSVSRWRAVSIARPSTDSLAVDTRGEWDDYYAGLSTRITSNLRRIRRKAEKTLGPITVVESQPAPAEVDAHLEAVVAVEGSGWKARRGSSLGARADLRDFFRRYGRRAAAKGRLRVSTLLFGGHLAAVELSVEAYQRVWQLKIGYQESLAAYYPGLQLTEASIHSAFDRGLDTYEFLGSAAPWEQRWRPEARPYTLVATYPVTASGLSWVCRDAAGQVWRGLHRLSIKSTP